MLAARTAVSGGPGAEDEAERGAAGPPASDTEVAFTGGEVTWIAQHGSGPRFGARPRRRDAPREVDDPPARLLLDGRLERGRRVTVGVRDDRLDPAVDQPAPAAATVSVLRPVRAALLQGPAVSVRTVSGQEGPPVRSPLLARRRN